MHEILAVRERVEVGAILTSLKPRASVNYVVWRYRGIDDVDGSRETLVAGLKKEWGV
jgi:hypothetical protein